MSDTTSSGGVLGLLRSLGEKFIPDFFSSFLADWVYHRGFGHKPEGKPTSLGGAVGSKVATEVHERTRPSGQTRARVRECLRLLRNRVDGNEAADFIWRMQRMYAAASSGRIKVSKPYRPAEYYSVASETIFWRVLGLLYEELGDESIFIEHLRDLGLLARLGEPRCFEQFDDEIEALHENDLTQRVRQVGEVAGQAWSAVSRKAAGAARVVEDVNSALGTSRLAKRGGAGDPNSALEQLYRKLGGGAP